LEFAAFSRAGALRAYEKNLRDLNASLDSEGGTPAQRDQALADGNRLPELLGEAIRKGSHFTGSDLYRRLGRGLGSDRAASEALAAAGIKGHVYDAGQIAGGGGDARNFVIYDDTAIDIVRKFHSREQGTTLGNIEFRAPQPGRKGVADIWLEPDANLSTLSTTGTRSGPSWVWPMARA
jgi:hypothetical protein